ncbi:MAG: archaeosortase/exosortase family protein [Candidatus Hydrogenedentes bacterium]|nr:archaeosortase/exosortase family protein [Candidatus Hydrogenedentota bacterium]
MSDERAAGENGPASAPASDGAAGTSKDSRRFVVLFIVYAMFPLLAYQYVLSTAAMDWYLFQVARHTAWVLGKVGHSGQLENASAFAGREAEVRAALSTVSSSSPLSSWEIWRYRALNAERAVARTSNDIRALEEAPALRVEANPSILDDIDKRVALLEGVQLSNDGRQTLNSIRAKLASVKTSSAGDETQRTQSLRALVNAVEALRAAQVTGLHETLKAAKARLQADRSPLVTFVYDPGSAGQKKPIEFRFRVAPECSAIPSMILYLAAVLAFPAGWRARFIGLFGGMPILYLVNILRLACLGIIGALTEGGPWFKFSHEYVWQGIYVVFVVAVWMAWVEYLVRRRSP